MEGSAKYRCLCYSRGYKGSISVICTDLYSSILAIALHSLFYYGGGGAVAFRRAVFGRERVA
jgi:hypothetical protein